MRLLPVLAVIVPLVPALGASCVGVETDRSSSPPGADSDSRPRPPLAGVRRGSFESHLLLTGTLEAVRSIQITAPRVPNGELQIRWMEEDGAFVESGQRVLEFDNASFAGDLEDRKLAASKKEKELRKLQAQSRADAAEKAFAVEERRVAMEKARLEAEVPKELLPLRDFQEKQLGLERASTEYEKAREALQTHLRTKEKEIAVERLSLDRMKYEIQVAEDAIEALVLRAPRSGVLVASDIPWQGRKTQIGDNVWPGFPLLSIPDLSEMRVIAKLSDVDDGEVIPGMTAAVTLDAYPEAEFEGEVVSVTPVAQETSPRSLRRAFTIAVSLSTTDFDRMRPGMAARVVVRTEAREDVLLMNRSAIDLSTTPPRVRAAPDAEEPIAVAGCNLFDCIVESTLREGRAR